MDIRLPILCAQSVTERGYLSLENCDLPPITKEDLSVVDGTRLPGNKEDGRLTREEIDRFIYYAKNREIKDQTLQQKSKTPSIPFGEERAPYAVTVIVNPGVSYYTKLVEYLEKIRSYVDKNGGDYPLSKKNSFSKKPPLLYARIGGLFAFLERNFSLYRDKLPKGEVAIEQWGTVSAIKVKDKDGIWSYDLFLTSQAPFHLVADVRKIRESKRLEELKKFAGLTVGENGEWLYETSSGNFTKISDFTAYLKLQEAVFCVSNGWGKPSHDSPLREQYGYFLRIEKRSSGTVLVSYDFRKDKFVRTPIESVRNGKIPYETAKLQLLSQTKSGTES